METRTTMHPALRALIAAGVIAGGVPMALLTWFWGVVLYTGCFISCSDPNIAGGIGMVAIAVVLVGTSVAAAGFAFQGWNRPVMVKLWSIGAAVGAILGFGTLIFA